MCREWTHYLKMRRKERQMVRASESLDQHPHHWCLMPNIKHEFHFINWSHSADHAHMQTNTLKQWLINGWMSGVCCFSFSLVSNCQTGCLQSSWYANSFPFTIKWTLCLNFPAVPGLRTINICTTAWNQIHSGVLNNALETLAKIASIILT